MKQPKDNYKKENLMNKIFMLTTFILFNACATSKVIYTPEGKKGYNITCSGSALNWGMCYEKAGEMCGSEGYTIIEKSDDKGEIVSANQFGLYGGSVINRNMLIVCGKEEENKK